MAFAARSCTVGIQPLRRIDLVPIRLHICEG
jgi:hypothetical protein